MIAFFKNKKWYDLVFFVSVCWGLFLLHRYIWKYLEWDEFTPIVLFTVAIMGGLISDEDSKTK